VDENFRKIEAELKMLKIRSAAPSTPGGTDHLAAIFDSLAEMISKKVYSKEKSVTDDRIQELERLTNEI